MPEERKVLLDIQYLKDQLARLVSDAQSEKDTRKRRHEQIDNRLDSITNALYGNHGNNGMSSRIKKLEEIAQEHKENSKNTFTKTVAIISLLLSATLVVLKIYGN